MTYGKEHFSQVLMPILERFCRDNDSEVQSVIAAGFHEIIRINKENGKSQQQLVGPFLKLMCSGTAEVIQNIVGNLDKTLELLYEEMQSSTYKVLDFFFSLPVLPF